MSTSIEYVCIFPFNENMEHVALVRKSKGPTLDHPDSQIGKLNGWGGKLELNEIPIQAVVREFEEESGLKISARHFRHFITECYQNGAIVHYFYIKGRVLVTHLSKSEVSLDGDIIVSGETDCICSLNPQHVWNVPYLLQMAKTLDKINPTEWPKFKNG